jgi:drug/metabolite transporter (DMT)-like permease
MKDTSSEPGWTGYAALFVAVALFSTVEIASKLLGRQAPVDPFILVFVRFFVTAVLLLMWSQASWRRRIVDFGWRDWGIFCLNGFVGITVSISLFHLAILSFRNAASSAVVFSANPVFVTVFARFINKESWNVRKWISVCMGCFGVGLFAWESGNPTSESLVGLSLMIGAAAFFALSICISRRFVSSYGAVPFMGFSSLFGSVMVLPVGLLRAGPESMASLVDGWMLVAYIAVFGTAVAYGAYYIGLSRTSAYQASMSFFLKPVMASVLSVLMLSEQLNAWTVCGTMLILAGLFLSVKMPKRKQKTETAPQREPVS